MSESVDKDILQAEETWALDKKLQVGQVCHWRGFGSWSDKEWEKCGNNYFNIFKKLLGRDIKDLRVLDYGCGGGCNLFGFSSVISHYTGADVSLKTIEHAKIEAERRNVDADWIHIDIKNPESSFERLESSFDLVICTAVIMHLPNRDYFHRVLKIIRNIVKEDGLVFIVMLTGRILGGAYLRRWKRSVIFKREEIDIEIKDAGFKLVNMFSKKISTYTDHYLLLQKV